MKIKITVQNGAIVAECGVIVKQHELLAALFDVVVGTTGIAVKLQALAIVQSGTLTLGCFLVYLNHCGRNVGLLFDDLDELVNRLVDAYHYVLEVTVVFFFVCKRHQPQVKLSISLF